MAAAADDDDDVVGAMNQWLLLVCTTSHLTGHAQLTNSNLTFQTKKYEIIKQFFKSKRNTVCLNDYKIKMVLNIKNKNY